MTSSVTDRRVLTYILFDNCTHWQLCVQIMSYAFQFCSAPVAELDNIHFKKLVRKFTPAHPSLFTGILIILQRMKVLRSLGSRLPVFSKCTVNGNGNIMLTNHSLLRDHDFYQARTPTKYFSLTSHVFRTTCSKKRIFIDKADELHPTY